MPITNVKLKMCSKSSVRSPFHSSNVKIKLVTSKLLSTKQTSLKGFHPASPPENMSQVFMLLPLTDTVKQVLIINAYAFLTKYLG